MLMTSSPLTPAVLTGRCLSSALPRACRTSLKRVAPCCRALRDQAVLLSGNGAARPGAWVAG